MRHRNRSYVFASIKLINYIMKKIPVENMLIKIKILTFSKQW